MGKQTEKDLLTDRMAREATFYTQENQNELDTLISKIQSGIAISEADKNRAATLAENERLYKFKRDEMTNANQQSLNKLMAEFSWEG
jgi:hypothetical protein